MGMNEYFFDSYALIELIKGNPRYIKYTDSIVIITVFNLVEVSYSVFLDLGEEKAKETYQRFQDCVHPLDWDITREALKLKQKYKQKNLSYADCIGYAFAQKKKIPFLTGDMGFKDLENVEWVQ